MFVNASTMAGIVISAILRCNAGLLVGAALLCISNLAITHHVTDEDCVRCTGNRLKGSNASIHSDRVTL